MSSLVKEFIGNDVRQINNQIYFRESGDYDQFAWHQDIMFREPHIFNEDVESDYFQTIIAVDDINEDNGATLSSGIKSLQTHGLCLESVWPYLEYNVYTKPPDYCYKQALKDKAIHCYNLPHNIYVMKECLLSGFPFVVGIAVFNDFENTKTGIIKLPNHNDIMIGGHAVLVCGYNDSKKHWIVRNSWGSSWGDNGYCYIPYEYLLNRRLSTELWCITKTKKFNNKNKNKNIIV
jgi:hypothetical protein